MTPNVDRGCTTHHFACDCREEHFRQTERDLVCVYAQLTERDTRIVALEQALRAQVAECKRLREALTAIVAYFQPHMHGMDMAKRMASIAQAALSANAETGPQGDSAPAGTGAGAASSDGK